MITRKQFDACVAELLALEQDWDSYGANCVQRARCASPPSLSDVNYAVAIVARLPKLPLPFMSPISYGVQLEWDTGEWEVEVEVSRKHVEFNAWWIREFDVSNFKLFDRRDSDTMGKVAEAVRLFVGGAR